MNNISKLLNDKTFLELTRENEESLPREVYSTKSNHVIIVDTGIIEVIPKKSSEENSLIISCGVHGNETGPIEIVDELLTKIIKEEIELAMPTLFIFGSPKGMNKAARELDFNLNRLFNGAWKNIDNCYEKSRAEIIEKACVTFNKKFSESKLLHYDLHTAIKESMHAKFGIYPYKTNQQSYANAQIGFLKDLGCEAILYSKEASNTFSCYSANDFDAHSFTVELGKVMPFGENDMNKFIETKATLQKLFTGEYHFNNQPVDIISYHVDISIIKKSEDFKFFFDKTTKNFTLFNKGDDIYQDGEVYKCPEDNMAIVFPNENVKIGQRSGLLVKRK